MKIMFSQSKRKRERHHKTEVKRRTIDLETKAEIVRQFERGVKVSTIAKTLGYAKSTICSILKDRERILAAEKESSGLKSSYTIRQGPVHEMEKHLISWIEEQLQNQVALSIKTIQAKACCLYEEIKQSYPGDCDENFTASKGWFYRFKKRANLDEMISCGEVVDVDLKACEEFRETLEKTISAENYLPEQIFTLGKIVLYFKKMPAQQEAKNVATFKTHKDRVTLLLGTNVVGHKLKPLFVFHCENPKAFKNVDKTSLPVYYRSNKNSWISQEMFENWFLECLIPEVNRYCAENHIPFKILLILDTLQCYPQNLNDLNPNFKVVFLPSGTSGFLQPMNQGATAIFKASYIQVTFVKAITATENSSYTLSDFWRDYNVLDAISNIDTAWKGISEVCLRGIWKNILNPSFLNLPEEFVKTKEMEPICNRIVKQAEELHLEVMIEDINQIVDVVDEYINDDIKAGKEDSAKNEDLVEPKLEITEDEFMIEERRESEMEITKPEFVNVLEGEIEFPVKQEKIEIDEFEGGFRDECMREGIDEGGLNMHGQGKQEIMDDKGQSVNQIVYQDFDKRQMESLCLAFSKINEGLDMFKKMDANFSRYTKVEYLIQKALTTYTDMYREKKKQNLPIYTYYQGPP